MPCCKSGVVGTCCLRSNIVLSSANVVSASCTVIREIFTSVGVFIVAGFCFFASKKT